MPAALGESSESRKSHAWVVQPGVIAAGRRRDNALSLEVRQLDLVVVIVTGQFGALSPGKRSRWYSNASTVVEEAQFGMALETVGQAVRCLRVQRRR